MSPYTEVAGDEAIPPSGSPEIGTFWPRKSGLTKLSTLIAERGQARAIRFPLGPIVREIPAPHPGCKFFVGPLARRNSAEPSGSFVRDDKLAFIRPSDDDYDQETDPCTKRAGREFGDARGPAWDPQLNELQ